MRLDASALRALNLTEAPGNIVSIFSSNPTRNYAHRIRTRTGLQQEHYTVRASEQVQDCARVSVAWELAEAAPGEQA